MVFYLLKLVITGAIIVIITEIAKINIKLAAVITAMPLVTILSILWMYYEGATNEKISFYLINTLTYIIPTIPMFIFFPYLLSKTNFFITLGISIMLIGLSAFLLNFILKVINT
jgi:hypothetical protein